MLVMVLIFRPRGLLGERLVGGPGLNSCRRTPSPGHRRRADGRRAALDAGHPCRRSRSPASASSPSSSACSASSPPSALVVGVLDIGHALLLAAAIGVGALLARRQHSPPGVLAAALAGAVARAALALLVAAARAANLRWMFVSLTPRHAQRASATASPTPRPPGCSPAPAPRRPRWARRWC